MTAAFPLLVKQGPGEYTYKGHTITKGYTRSHGERSWTFYEATGKRRVARTLADAISQIDAFMGAK